MSTIKLKSVDYKVFGKVMDVYFHKYARKTAQRHHILGYIQCASDGTMVGTIQGEPKKIDRMKQWLIATGSPLSKIERCEFSNERDIPKMEFKDYHFKRRMFFVYWT